MKLDANEPFSIGDLPADVHLGDRLACMTPFLRSCALRELLLRFDRNEREQLRTTLVAARGPIGATLDLVRAVDTAMAFDRHSTPHSIALARRTVMEAADGGTIPYDLGLAPEFALGRWLCRFERRAEAGELLDMITTALSPAQRLEPNIVGPLAHLAGCVVDNEGFMRTPRSQEDFLRSEEALSSVIVSVDDDIERRTSELLLLGELGLVKGACHGLPLLLDIIERQLTSATPARHFDLLAASIPRVSQAIAMREGAVSSEVWRRKCIAAMALGHAPQAQQSLLLACLVELEGRNEQSAHNWTEAIACFENAASLLQDVAGDNPLLRWRIAHLLRLGSATARRLGQLERAIGLAEHAAAERRTLVDRGLMAGVALYFDVSTEMTAWATRGAWQRVAELADELSGLLDTMFARGEIDSMQRLTITTTTERMLEQVMTND